MLNLEYYLLELRVNFIEIINKHSKKKNEKSYRENCR